MENIVGQAVQGENYFHRPLLEKKLFKKLKSRSSLLIPAPRRVGKTSFSTALSMPHQNVPHLHHDGIHR